MTLSFDPSEVSAAERGWDDQHLYLRGARTTFATAPTDGFTDAVRATADRFTAAWERHACRLAIAAEAEADGIRLAMSAVLASDQRGRGDAGLLSRVTEAILADLLREYR